MRPYRGPASESPPGRNPRGLCGRSVVYGFGGAAACAGDTLAGVIGGGSTIAVGSLSSRRPLTGWFWHDRRRRTRLRGGRDDSDATAEARFPGGRVVR